MQHFRELLLSSAIYSILVGLISLSPSFVAGVFAYQIKDLGVLLVFAGESLSLGVVLLGLHSLVAKEMAETGSARLAKYRGAAAYLTVAFAIGVVELLWGWLSGLFTLRTVIVPLIIYVIFMIWAWHNRESRFK